MEANIMINNHYTIEDIINSDKHMELIAGEAVIQDMTSVSHNITVQDISTALKNYITENNGTCKIFTENVALYTNELLNDNSNLYLPDVMVVCEPNGIQEDGIHAAPLFIAEVTSESTKKYDYCEKLETYRKIGVDEYWIVDIQKNIVYKYLKSEDYIPQVFMHTNSIDVSVYPGLSINISVIS